MSETQTGPNVNQGGERTSNCNQFIELERFGPRGEGFILLVYWMEFPTKILTFLLRTFHGSIILLNNCYCCSRKRNACTMDTSLGHNERKSLPVDDGVSRLTVDVSSR